ncbi:MAG: MFS transporter [Steroidobacteraceae bacterium]|nr:MFS transporter [Steroidobacteraceae bacterium]
MTAAGETATGPATASARTPSQFRLLAQRRFLPFFGAQALGAFNDNVYRNVLVILIAFHGASAASLPGEVLTNLAGGVFILPFVLLSGLAGQIADRFDKSRIVQAVKASEILIMVLAGAGLATFDLGLLFLALFLLGVHSTFFAPAKYGLLPQILRPAELVGGNALLEAGTFLAILLGTLAGGVLAGSSGTSVIVFALVALAGIGFVLSLAMPRVLPADPQLVIDWNPWRSTLANLRAARESRTVFLSILGNSWFWFCGALVLAQLPLFVRVVLNGTETVVTLFLVVFSAGVGAGSLLCEALSARKVEIGLVPFGSIGLTVFALDLALAAPAQPAPETVGAAAFLQQPGAWRLLVDLGLVGVSGGIFVVPLYALIQQRSRPEAVSRVISANNILNSLFIVAAALFAATALRAGLTIPQLIGVMAVMNAAVAIYIYTLVPEFLLRFLSWLLIHVVYRLRVEGIDRIPDRGPALLICNHVSFVDPIVISAACRRPVRFIMDASIFRIPVLNAVFRGMKAIPVAPAREEPETYERAFAVVAQELRAGQLVCIFPEGRLTPDGEVQPFRPGLLRILRETPVPVIPLALSNLWGSMFSRFDPAPWKRLPRRFLARITLAAGEPVPPEAVSLEDLRERVLALRHQP